MDRADQLEPVDWVDIPAGTLRRGTPAEELTAVARRYADTGVPAEWYLKEAPRAEVHVPAFRIARTQVTVARWARFAAATDRPAPRGPGVHPVVGVTWEAANAYCRWLGERLGSDVRLPTEDEWERAARGDDGREFPWGDAYRTGLANLVDLGIGTTTPVGSFPEGASPFGVLDMAGNADEWTSTAYAPYPGATAEVPLTEDWAFDRHVTRGGAYRHDRDLARCARRHGAYEQDLEAIGVGFRLAAPCPSHSNRGTTEGICQVECRTG
ncbi:MULTISPECIES: formylglycine-generating enzyme family protein [unclassified Streptomyces]|uniref:formylglycine-generating enzyme family protein n=1 Tax=unclassified Streptomyces TaxID=2593676 RepID=UPI0033CA6BAF